MTNSEEPSAPEGISSMKVSEYGGPGGGGQHNHPSTFGNYSNGGGDNINTIKENGTAFTLASTTTSVRDGSGSGPAYVPSSSSSTSTSSSSSCSVEQATDNNVNVPVNSLPHQQHQRGSVLAIAVGQQQPQPQLPFTLICGEEVEHKTEVSDGILVLTNYRLFLQTKESSYNIPLGVVESVDCRDIFFLHLNCKDARCIRCTFPNNEAALDMMKRIQQVISPGRKVEDSFAFAFFKKTHENSVSEEVKAHLGWDLPSFPTPKERFDAEVKRMEFNVHGPWRVSDENKDYELCNSYPTHIIVPCVMDKKKLEEVARFRSARRFPAVVWRHKGNGAVISRCSQPEVGWFGWRSNEDEELVNYIVLACADNARSTTMTTTTTESQTKTNEPKDPSLPSSDESRGGGMGGYGDCPPPSPGALNSMSSIEVVPEPPNIKKLLILDARSYSTAVVNRARGGGCECLEYYTNCEIQFMNLANIHSIRKSFINVRQLCALPADQANSNWFSQLESCKWLQHMSGLMKAAVTVAQAIENDGRPVMVHCSDGWDRTPQIVALAEILLDPYYRSLEGFQVLVEREWLDFGHKFADRCGQGGSEDTNERCPVFLQWLDCLHQLVLQFPSAFEFNLTFLVKLAQHTYSSLFGTFLCNTAKERHELNVYSSTHSVWRFLRAPANYDKFRNHLYSNCDQVLWPCCEVRALRLWSAVYLGFDNPAAILSDIGSSSHDSSPAPSVAADGDRTERISNHKLEQSKARSSSCENLHHPHAEQLQRRKSDPSLSDSLLGIESEEVEKRCLPHTGGTGYVLTANSREMDTTAKSSEPNNENDLSDLGIELTTFSTGDPEDVSENEDTETNSEEKSESTVINLTYFKSVESSTDTLVAELGHAGETSSGIQKFIKEVNNKTDDEELESAREDILRKTEENLDKTETIRHDRDSSKECDNQVVEKSILPPDLDQIGGNQQCEVCATNRKLLDDVVASTTSGVLPTGAASTIPSTGSNGGPCVQTVPTSSTAIAVTTLAGSNGGKFSSYNTPMHSRTPSTGIPATPEETLANTTGKNLVHERWNIDIVSNTLMVRPSYDVDGLEPLHDEVQSRLSVIISGYKMRIDSLQKELQMYRDALIRQVCHKCTHTGAERADDAVSVADSLCSAEHQSVGHESHSSEISFEAIDERDTRPPLWIPDYAVTKCMGCDATFWLGKRKHHCRSCGKIFCADCSEHQITIPSEQLFTPVRVCSSCFNRWALMNGTPPTSTNGLIIMNGNTNGLLHGNGTNNGGYEYNNTPPSSTSESPITTSTLLQVHSHRLSEEINGRSSSSFCNGGGNNVIELKTKLSNDYRHHNHNHHHQPVQSNGVVQDEENIHDEPASSNGHLTYE